LRIRPQEIPQAVAGQAFDLFLWQMMTKTTPNGSSGRKANSRTGEHKRILRRATGGRVDLRLELVQYRQDSVAQTTKARFPF
jgi:hypothetical protein